jgi:hypothetical protein
LQSAFAYEPRRITLTESHFGRVHPPLHTEETAMIETPRNELDRENGDTHSLYGSGPGHGEPPVNDPPPAEQPQEAPGETGEPELQAQARASVQAFERAIARLAG